MLSETIEEGIVNTIMRQMGATKIKTMMGSINIVTFILGENFEVQYVYEMKDNKTIYLQRVTPYEHFIGEPEDSDALVAAIKEDLSRYKAAYESDNFDRYLRIAEKAYQAKKQREDIFLSEKYANPEDLARIEAAVDQVLEILDETQKNLDA